MKIFACQVIALLLLCGASASTGAQQPTAAHASQTPAAAQTPATAQSPHALSNSPLVQVAAHEFCMERILERHNPSDRARITLQNAVRRSAFSVDQIPSFCPIVEPVAHSMKELAMKLRFVDGPKVTRLTPKEKARLAARNLFDPFNLLTLGGQSAFATAIDSHSPYGPGFHGFGNNLGVSFTEDMTGEFFGTFLVPAVFRQDPHYHRMPQASIKRRILHTAIAVVWAQGDNGRGMPNYAFLVGSAISGEFANFYVPDQQTNLRATSTRYVVNLATAPTDNLITEFLPDIAKRIHFHDVFIQNIINNVAKTNPQ